MDLKQAITEVIFMEIHVTCEDDQGEALLAYHLQGKKYWFTWTEMSHSQSSYIQDHIPQMEHVSRKLPFFVLF